MIRRLLPVALLCLLPFAAQAAPAKAPAQPELIAASGTSYGEGSSPVSSLLDPQHKGFWTPQTADAGVSEGIYLQFKDPVHITFIKVEVEGYSEALELEPYLDGRTGLPQKRGSTGSKPGNTDPDSDSEYGTREFGIQPLRTPAGNQSFVLGGGWGEKPLHYEAKSVFFKIAKADENAPPVKVVAIRLYTQETFEPGNEPLVVKLPQSLRASASATSTLAPQFAYDVSHLFDSQVDMAWATDGKTTDGRNESLSVDFGMPVTVSGLIIWNGYQRSDTHYKANGRVKTLDVNGQTVTVKDTQGAQSISLPKPVEAESLKLTIKDIYPGGSYKDVLMSELRFVAPGGGIILPVVEAPTPKLTATTAYMSDRVFAPFIHETAWATADPSEWVPTYDKENSFEMCHDSSLRLRSNGTFVIYSAETGQAIAGGDPSRTALILRGISEGNWEPLDDHDIRLFGKKYRVATDILGVGYLQSTQSVQKPPAPKIFQSAMKVYRYKDLPAAERRNLLRFIVDERRREQSKRDSSANYESSPYFCISAAISRPEAPQGKEIICGAGLEQALDKVDARLMELNPLTVRSDIYTEILLPNAQNSGCSELP